MICLWRLRISLLKNTCPHDPLYLCTQINELNKNKLRKYETKYNNYEKDGYFLLFSLNPDHLGNEGIVNGKKVVKGK